MADTQIESTAQATLLATFFVGDALCALDAAGVQEVIRVESVTAGPARTPGSGGSDESAGQDRHLARSGDHTRARQERPRRSESRVFIIEDRNEFLGILVDRAGK